MTNIDYFPKGDGEGAAGTAMMGSDEEDIMDLRLPTPTTKYRESTIGKLLMETVDQMKDEKKISAGLCDKILCQFDRSILNALSHRLTARVTFKATKLHTYRFLDGVWTFILDQVEFREHNNFANVPQLKILAFDGKVPVPRALSANGKKRWRNGQIQGQNLEQQSRGAN